MNTQLLLPSPTHIQHCAQALLQGRLVAFPTETVFGLGAAVSQPQALEAIFAAKGRPANHPLIAHVSLNWVQLSLQNRLQHRSHPWVGALSAQQQADWQALAQAFWPGPLTIIVPKGPAMPMQVTGGQASVGIRCPSHPVAMALLNAVGVPVAAPSANRFGKVSPTRAAHVLAELGGRIPYVLDGEVPSVGIESTIVSLLGPQPVVLRPGAILPEDLARVLGRPVVHRQGLDLQLLNQQAGALDAPQPLLVSALRVSGSLAQHYSPDAAMRLCSAAELEQSLLALQEAAQATKQAGLWPSTLLVGWSAPFLQTAHALESTAKHGLPPSPTSAVAVHALPNSPVEVAQALYLVLRMADEQGWQRLWVEMPPATAAWAAVVDRLQRAANQGL